MSVSLTFDPLRQVFLKSDVLKFKNENCLSFQIMLVWKIFLPTLISQSRTLKLSAERKYALTLQKEKFTERFKKKLWSLVI